MYFYAGDSNHGRKFNKLICLENYCTQNKSLNVRRSVAYLKISNQTDAKCSANAHNKCYSITF